jgi:hypothetical protein
VPNSEDIVLFIVLFVTVLPGMWGWSRWRRRHILSTWKQVEAEVVEKVSGSVENAEMYPRVAYEFGGQKYRSLAMDWYSVGLIAPIGTKVDVLVNPVDPNQCVVYSEKHIRNDRLIE